MLCIIRSDWYSDMPEAEIELHESKVLLIQFLRDSFKET